MNKEVKAWSVWGGAILLGHIVRNCEFGLKPGCWEKRSWGFILLAVRCHFLLLSM